MNRVDDLGVEIDEEVEKALADPKSGILLKVIEYCSARRAKQHEIEQQEKATKKSEGVFGNLFS